MSQPTINQVSAVSPVLSNMLLAYMQDASRFVASRVFPPLQVAERNGTYYLIDKKHFFIDGLQERAPGAAFAGVGYSMSTATYATIQYAGEDKIADEERAANQAPGELEQDAVEHLAQLSLLRKERAFSADFMKTSVWGTDDNNSATDWDDFASGDPVSNVYTAVRTIGNNTGKEANTIVMGFIVFDALRLHPDILDRLKYTQMATTAGIEQALAALLGLQNLFVSKASYNSANEGQTGTYAAIIDDDALICYVDPVMRPKTVTAGKTFYWQPGGGLGTIYRVREDAVHADLIQHKEQWDQKVTASDLGYFFADIV